MAGVAQSIELQNFMATKLKVNSDIKFTMVRKENHKLPFLDVLLDNNSNQVITTSMFHKKTYTSLPTNYYSFAPFSHKLG